MGKSWMHGNGRCVKGDMAGFWEWCVPMSSVKPPTGSRQVPVTNWSRRILFSLSISFTTCRKLSPSSCCNVPNWYVCVRVSHSVCVPARTSESACCSWCSVYKWCSSANLPGRSLASHRASASTHRKHQEFSCISSVFYTCVNQRQVATGRRRVESHPQLEQNIQSSQ